MPRRIGMLFSKQLGLDLLVIYMNGYLYIPPRELLVHF